MNFDREPIIWPCNVDDETSASQTKSLSVLPREEELKVRFQFECITNSCQSVKEKMPYSIAYSKHLMKKKFQIQEKPQKKLFLGVKEQESCVSEKREQRK